MLQLILDAQYLNQLLHTTSKKNIILFLQNLRKVHHLWQNQILLTKILL